MPSDELVIGGLGTQYNIGDIDFYTGCAHRYYNVIFSTSYISDSNIVSLLSEFRSEFIYCGHAIKFL